MTSWIRVAPRSGLPPPRLGYFQSLPEGTFAPPATTEPPATVVTAYYEMKSKHTPTKYREWISRFLRTLTCPIVFFTDAETLPFLESCPRVSRQVEFIVLPRSQWKANDLSRFPARTWEAQHMIDPERAIHSVELYKVWYEKKEFVLRAMERNPFSSTKFVWTDAGIMRNAEFEELLRGRYPYPSRIPTDRMMILNYAPFTLSDEADYMINRVSIKGGGKDKPRLMGNIFAATAAVWRSWSALYDQTVQRYLKAGLFFGKDQTVCMTMTLENKGAVSLLDLKKIAPEPWFYMLLYLSVPDRVWDILRSDQADKEKWTYKRFIEECGPAPIPEPVAAPKPTLEPTIAPALTPTTTEPAAEPLSLKKGAPSKNPSP